MVRSLEGIEEQEKEPAVEKKKVNQHKNVLVTGANGYLAQNIIQSLSSHTIHKLTRENNSKEYILECNPDIVIHTICSYGRDKESISSIYDSNFIVGMRILQTLKELEKSVTFINCGSGLQKYNNLYSISKTQFVELGKFLSDDKLRFVNMNLEHFYGPSAPNNFISLIVNKCKNNESIPLTEGKQRRDFIHVYDVCSAFNAVLNHIDTLDSFVEIDVGTGISTPVRAVVELIKKNSNSNSKLLFGEVPLANNQASEMCANTKKLESLGWKPKYNLEKGLIQLL